MTITPDGIVCLLDDDQSVLKATTRLLSSAGWKVEPFLDPTTFLRYAREHKPEVVVIDIWMPEMNGLEVQSRLRTLSPSTQVIVLTGKDDPMVRSRAMHVGAFAFLTKPVSDNELLDSIESAVSRT